MKRVYVEPAWRLARSFEELMANPPTGYQFFTQERVEDSAVALSFQWGLLRVVWRGLQERGLPANLIKAYLDRFRRPPLEADLTWAVTHLVFRKVSWVLDMMTELPAILVGHEWHFRRYRGIVRRCLLSPYCRKIITSVQIGKEALARSLDSQALEEKIEVIYPAVAKKAFAKAYNHGCRLLFVNSSNLPDQFDLKGGKEALEAFLILRKRYPFLELVVRSDVPRSIRERFQGVPGLTFIEDTLPWQKLEAQFLAADIFLMPTHITPYAVFVEAMSYELPVVTTDAWGNGELVEDGRMGFLVPKSSLAPDFLPGALWGRTRDFVKVLTWVDAKMVEALVKKLSILIETPELRRRLGRAGRQEVEEGRFSIAKRNQALKRVLDQATEREG